MAVSYDSQEVLQRFAKQSKIDYPLLSDPGSAIIKNYGLLNTALDDTKYAGVPHPATFLIDASGVIRAKLSRRSYRQRHKPSELIEAAKKLK